MTKNYTNKIVMIVPVVIVVAMIVVFVLSYHHVKVQLSPAYRVSYEITEPKSGEQYYCYKCNIIESLIVNWFFKGDYIETSDALHSDWKYYRIQNHETKELLIAEDHGHIILCRFYGFHSFVIKQFPAAEVTIKEALDSLHDIYGSGCSEDIKRIVIQYPRGFQDGSQKQSVSIDDPKEISNLWDVIQKAVISDLRNTTDGHVSIKSSDRQPSITLYFANNATLFLSLYDLEGAFFQIEWGCQAFLSLQNNETLKTIILDLQIEK